VRTVTLIDRGWCSECAAGSAGCNASHSIEAAAATLEALKCDESLWPRIEREDTPVAFALPIDHAQEAGHLDRRAFFGAFVKRVASAAQTAPVERVKAGPGARLPSPTIRESRQRFAKNVNRLAAEAGVRVPAAIVPYIAVGPGCDHSGMCAAVCPSGALRRYDDEEAALTGLEFEAELCIACGVCAERCPSQALRMRPGGEIGEALPEAPVRLTRFARRQCARCGEGFVSQSGQSECASCMKDHALFASLFPAFSREAQPSAEADRC
jgi:formate hydrogenlyase subunit 6/NADH:ubiquinone oxidoreductase subunit I